MKDIVIGNMRFELPVGYKHVTWNYVNKDDTVYTIGLCNGKPIAYGPFKVSDPDDRKLFNVKRGVVFDEPVESLLIKVGYNQFNQLQ